jgi:hypothetical protein
MSDVTDAPAADAPTEADLQRADKFYDRARKVAEASQWDYAIEMFLSGLEFDPGNVDVHKELRKVALTRKATGGKPLGSLKAMGLKKKSKDLKANLLNARKLLAYDPGNAQYMELTAAAAAKLDLAPVVVWVGPLLYHALLDQPKQAADPYVRLKEIYRSVGEFQLAQDALQQAAALRPDDNDLQHELRDLATQEAIRRGQYEKGDFRTSVKDADRQKELLDEDADIRTVDALQARIEQARREYKADPVSGKLSNLIDVLVKTGELKYENEALDLLERAHTQTNNYRWKFLAGQVQIVQFARAGRMLRTAAEAEPDNAAAQKEREDHDREQLQMEIAHFRGAMKAYPNDQRFKYETGRRLFQLGDYTDAIPVLQQSQNDVKYREDSRLMLGRSFLEADFVDEAADTLRNLIEAYKIDGDDRAKEMYYWYARALEEKGDIPDALKAYSQIAQWDFGYRDVQGRIKTLRGKG